MKNHPIDLRNMKTYYLLVAFLSLVTFSCNKKTYVGDLLISNTNIIDVDSGKVLEAQDVVIKADTIAYK